MRNGQEAPSGYLPQTPDTRHDQQSLFIIVCVFLDFPDQSRTRPDQTHIPIRTLKSCYNSSMLHFPMQAPSFVTRGFRFILNIAPLTSLYFSKLANCSSASTFIKRSLYILNSSPSFPTRSWQKKTIPFGLSHLISIAIIQNTGDKRISPDKVRNALESYIQWPACAKTVLQPSKSPRI